MNDICCCNPDTDHYVGFYKAIPRIARKEHECCECGDVITKGQKYEEIKMLCDGDFSIDHLCQPCRGIIRDFLCGYHPVGGAYETFWECNGFYPNEIPDDWEDEE